MKAEKQHTKLKRAIIVLLLLSIVFLGYVIIVNRNSANMTGRQKFLKAVYPIFTGYKRLMGKTAKVLTNEKNVQPVQSLYDLSVQLNDGTLLKFESFREKKILLVNTASDCGYTAQYEDLQNLYEQYKDNLVIIGFPANDFKEQEKGTDVEIAGFCKANYGITFPLATKNTVLKGSRQQKVFQWLTEKDKNGWNDKQPTWNFSKYLINEKGVLTHYFDPAVSPMSDKVTKAINE